MLSHPDPLCVSQTCDVGHSMHRLGAGAPRQRGSAHAPAPAHLAPAAAAALAAPSALPVRLAALAPSLPQALNDIIARALAPPECSDHGGGLPGGPSEKAAPGGCAGACVKGQGGKQGRAGAEGGPSGGQLRCLAALLGAGAGLTAAQAARAGEALAASGADAVCPMIDHARVTLPCNWATGYLGRCGAGMVRICKAQNRIGIQSCRTAGQKGPVSKLV